MRRGPHQLALPLPPTTYQSTNLLLRLALIFMTLRHSNSCRAVFPGRPLVPGIITSSLVLGPIVRLPIPRIPRCVKVSCLCGRLITLTIDRFDDDPRIHLSWLGEWIPGSQMEERPVGELPQHGRPLGVHDPSGGTVPNVGSGRFKRSGPLVVAKGLELDGNGSWHRY